MHKTWKRVCLDTAAEEQPSFFERELTRVMRELPVPVRTARNTVRTRNGNIVEAR